MIDVKRKNRDSCTAQQLWSGRGEPLVTMYDIVQDHYGRRLQGSSAGACC